MFLSRGTQRRECAYPFAILCICVRDVAVQLPLVGLMLRLRWIADVIVVRGNDSFCCSFNAVTEITRGALIFSQLSVYCENRKSGRKSQEMLISVSMLKVQPMFYDGIYGQDYATEFPPAPYSHLGGRRRASGTMSTIAEIMRKRSSRHVSQNEC